MSADLECIHIHGVGSVKLQKLNFLFLLHTFGNMDLPIGGISLSETLLIN